MNITSMRFFSDDQKEEAWINEMSAQGWHLKKFFTIFFTFDKGEPGKYIYRNEYVGGKSLMLVAIYKVLKRRKVTKNNLMLFEE
ncbi:hypothetical protein AEA09_09970 [Lysinibacillus contaminans]|uniref:DUF2812 domain-containing protein n=1 Tax=Lysinibacillus contaminans TaxID=1293441 RepID=A0ABR5K3A9_9BACI|nr:DUF2812 domain-containing protein [Lysinibacillus contaminans]KOS68834.1 hypothetical protein AEA09_09970 [Lysinibacillus contaminans]